MLFLPCVAAKTGTSGDPEMYYSALITSSASIAVIAFIVGSFVLAMLSRYIMSSAVCIIYAGLMVLLDLFKPTEFHERLLDKGLTIISETRAYGHYMILLVAFATFMFAMLSIATETRR